MSIILIYAIIYTKGWEIMSNYPLNKLPIFAEDFLDYIESIQNKSSTTVKEYYYDLMMFFRFMKKRRGLLVAEETLDDADVSKLNVDIVQSVSLSDFYSFLNYISSVREAQSVTRARKVATLKSFFKYLHTKARIIDSNPATELETPKITRKLPRYLELEESLNLLKSIDGKNKERDFCMILMFLNSGLRVSELVDIDIPDIRLDNTLVVRGKGAKERTIYLSNSVSQAIDKYLLVRPEPKEGHEDALFLSERKIRISPNTVGYTVKKFIKKANLDPKKYSTHKLRHTAATLMYQHGDVDIRSIQEILGHESVATTEIYTHVSNKMLKKAVESNPLADIDLED